MKTYLRTVLAVFAIAFAITGAMAQTKISEGKIVFTITMADNDMDPQMASMMPKEMTMSFKGDKSKSDMAMGMGNMSTIYDSKTKLLIQLMDMMGQKNAIKMTEADVEKQAGKQKKTSIKYLDDTKVICGYTCHKAEVSVEGEKDKQIVYYTKDIVSKNANAIRGGLKDLEGFPLEYEMNMKGMSVKMTAKSISIDKIDDIIFKIPEGYKEMTMEQAMQMGGGH